MTVKAVPVDVKQRHLIEPYDPPKPRCVTGSPETEMKREAGVDPALFPQL
jgi:hypothetical protein